MKSRSYLRMVSIAHLVAALISLLAAFLSEGQAEIINKVGFYGALIIFWILEGVIHVDRKLDRKISKERKV